MVCGCDFAHLATCLWKEGEPHRQLMYDLEKSFNELKNVRTRLRDKTDVRNRAISNAEDKGSIAPETLTGWIRRVEDMEAKLESILGPENNLNQLPEECLGGCCYVKCLSAYKLAKRIAETLPQAEALIKESLEHSEAFAPAPLDELSVDQTFDGLSPAVQSCFLYFSLFPRDYSVRKEELLDYWLRENFLTEAPALKTTRSKGESIFSALNAAYLLEKGEDDNILRMHDTRHGYAL